MEHKHILQKAVFKYYFFTIGLLFLGQPGKLFAQKPPEKSKEKKVLVHNAPSQVSPSEAKQKNISKSRPNQNPLDMRSKKEAIVLQGPKNKRAAEDSSADIQKNNISYVKKSLPLKDGLESESSVEKPFVSNNSVGKQSKQIIGKNSGQTSSKKLTLGILNDTQQEILLLQAQIELDKLKQKLNELSGDEKTSSHMLQNNFTTFDNTQPPPERIVMFYSISGTNYVRMQLAPSYEIDMKEGDVLPSGEILDAIYDHYVVFKNQDNALRKISIV